jgi:hypothetical protein
MSVCQQEEIRQMGWIVFLIIGGAIAAIVSAIIKASARDRATFDRLMDELMQDPLNPSIHSDFLRTVNALSGLNTARSQRAYDAALSILEAHPESTSARTFALSVGRWHFGRIRDDKKVTIYDEQAMQNDILVRSQSFQKQGAAVGA